MKGVFGIQNYIKLKLKYIYIIELAIIVIQIMLVMAVMHNNEQHAVERGKNLIIHDCTPTDFKKKTVSHNSSNKIAAKIGIKIGTN